MELLLGFVLGFVIGVGLFIGYGYYQVNKIRKTKDSLINALKAKAEEIKSKEASIKDRLVEAAKLAQTQMDLRAQAEMPSSNSLHSRYKNGLVAEIADLEQRKIDILRTVLGDGFDPMITVVNDAGVREEIPLSEYVATAADHLAKHGYGSEPTPPPVPTDPGQPKKVGKFIIYNGGKGDGTTH
jgi:hypothetical protein